MSAQCLPFSYLGTSTKENIRAEDRVFGNTSTKGEASGDFFNKKGRRRELKIFWLATQCRSHCSPHKFPANREYYREFFRFRTSDRNHTIRSSCVAATFRAIPYTV